MEMLDELLNEAIAAHQAVLLAYEAVDVSCLSGDDEELERQVERLPSVVAAAREADRAVMNVLDGVALQGRHLQTIREYHEVLRKVAGQNQGLLGRARVHRALAVAELTELRQGKTALAGYRRPQEGRGVGLSETY